MPSRGQGSCCGILKPTVKGIESGTVDASRPRRNSSAIEMSGGVEAAADSVASSLSSRAVWLGWWCGSGGAWEDLGCVEGHICRTAFVLCVYALRSFCLPRVIANAAMSDVFQAHPGSVRATSMRSEHHQMKVKFGCEPPQQGLDKVCNECVQANKGER